MREPDSTTRFVKVDEAKDPTQFVKYLEAVTSTDFAKAYKQLTFSLLDIRPGSHVLDVGCGLGDDVRTLAEMVGSSGRAVGMDYSETMVNEARRRTIGTGLRAEFLVGDAYHLDFSDSSFDATRPDRVYQHLHDPNKALGEMVRVTGSGGRLAIADPDWDMLVVDSSERTVTRRILALHSDEHPNGWIGRQLPRLFQKSGLADVSIKPVTMIVNDYALADPIFGLSECAERAAEKGIITKEERKRWLESREDARREDCFFSAVTVFVVCGRKL